MRKLPTKEGPTAQGDDQAPALTHSAEQIATALLAPSNNTASVVEMLSRGQWGPQSMLAFSEVLSTEARAADRGDLSTQREMLVSQSFALHGMFTEMARRAALNLGGSLGAVETYTRLALKAQAQSRATIEALERLVNDGAQTVRHVHVSEGGQAIVADQFYHHAESGKHENSVEQPHAKRARGSALLGSDPLGDGLPVSGSRRKATVSDARREGKRRAQGQ